MAHFARCPSKTEDAALQKTACRPHRISRVSLKYLGDDSNTLALGVSAPIETPYHAWVVACSICFQLAVFGCS